MGSCGVGWKGGAYEEWHGGGMVRGRRRRARRAGRMRMIVGHEDTDVAGVAVIKVRAAIVPVDDCGDWRR